VTAKYSAFPALGFGVGAALWLSLKDWRRGFGILTLQVLLMVIGAALLLYGYGAIALFNRGEAATFVAGGLEQYRNLVSLNHVLGLGQSQISIGIAGVIIAAIGIVHYMRFAERWQQVSVGMIIIVAVSLLVSVLFYVVAWHRIHRYISPATITTVILVGIGFAGFAQLVTAAIKNPLERRRAFTITFGILSLLWLLPPTITSVQQALKPNYPRVEGQIIEWSRLALHDGTILLPQESGWLWVYFDGEFGGYPAPLRTWAKEPITNRPLSEWPDMYVNYAFLRDREIEQLQASEIGRNLLEEMLLLRTFPTHPTAPWSGETTHIYSTWGINHPLGVTFAEQINLHGLHLDVPEAIQSGSVITFTPFWQALAPIATDYQLFVHIIPQNDAEIIAQVDMPAATDQYPMTQWQVEDNAIVGRSISVTLPSNIQPGSYRVVIGLYDLATFQRLTTRSQLDYATVYEFTILE
jgi:hypothetical protein